MVPSSRDKLCTYLLKLTLSTFHIWLKSWDVFRGIFFVLIHSKRTFIYLYKKQKNKHFNSKWEFKVGLISKTHMVNTINL